jgi:hypothetical protein
MASQHASGSYDRVTPHVLEQAMRDVWEVLKAHNPYRDWDNDPVLKKQVALTLMALADRGVTSPQELLSRTLDCFDLKPPH